MKIIRSSKCSIKYTTQLKQQQLKSILVEYAKVVNYFINLFWDNQFTNKNELLKDIVNSADSWFTHRMKKVAAREAIDMISASINKHNNEKKELENKLQKATKISYIHKLKRQLGRLKLAKPVHTGKRMCLLSTVGVFKQSDKTKQFTNWLELRCIGNKIKINIPIRLHKHFNKLQSKGKPLNYFIITNDYIQFSFEIETGPKKEDGEIIGVDSGINYMASLSNGKQYGENTKQLIKTINRCKHGSKRQQCLRRSLRQLMDEVASQITSDDKTKMIVVEKLKGLGRNTKKRIYKGVRRLIGSWGYRYFLGRIESGCEWNRVSFRTVYPYYTSIKCPQCGYTNQKNRSSVDKTVFLCLKCGHLDGKADCLAAKNIAERFITGAYGPGCKEEKLPC